MSLYQQAVDKALELKQVTDEYASIRRKLQPYVERTTDKVVRKSFGTFSIIEYPQYQYSDTTQELQARLDELKKLEVETGEAKLIKTNTSLRITPKAK